MLRNELTFFLNNLHSLRLTSIIWLKQVSVHRIFYNKILTAFLFVSSSVMTALSSSTFSSIYKSTRTKCNWINLKNVTQEENHFLCTWHIREFKIHWRRRQRESKKNNWFNEQNNNFTRASRFFLRFFPVFACLRRDKGQILRFMEDVNKQQRNFISLFELGYGPLKFSFWRVHLHFTK